MKKIEILADKMKQNVFKEYHTVLWQMDSSDKDCPLLAKRPCKVKV